MMRFVRDDPIHRRGHLAPSAQPLVRYEGAPHLCAFHRHAPCGTQRGRRDDERMRPVTGNGQCNVRLASSHVVADQATALLRECARRSRQGAALIVAQQHRTKPRRRQRVEACRGNRRAGGSQSCVGE